MQWNTDPASDVDGIKDGIGQYIIDPDFLLFSTKECCNNYIQQLNANIIQIESQFGTEKQWVYGSKANPDLLCIQRSL